MSIALTKSVSSIGGSGTYTYRCIITENSYNISDNTSNITITFAIKGPWSPSFYQWSTNYGIIVDGSVKKTGNSSPYVSTSYYTLLSWTGNISHNSNGSKSINIGVYLDNLNGSANYLPKQSTSSSYLTMGTVTLTTIPRASTITSASNITLGNKCSIKWTPASSDFKYKIKFSLGSWSYTTDYIKPSTTSAYTYTGYTIPNTSALLDDIPSSTTGTMKATLTTYNSSGTTIGSASSKTFTVTIPSSVKPTFGSISFDPANITTKDGTSRNILVKGKNKLAVKVSGCSAGTGSSIKSYKYFGQNISSTTTATSVTSSSVINPSISGASTSLTYKVTVTDNRGRVNSGTNSITCYNYSAPTFSSFSAYRSNSSGTADNNGTYIYCSYKVKYYYVNNTNKIHSFSISGVTSSNITYKDWSYSTSSGITTATGTALIKNCATTSSYSLKATLVDNYGGSVASSSKTISSAERIINIRKNGTGIAFGKMAESNNSFECGWPAKFDSNCAVNGVLTVGVSTQDSAPTSGIKIHDVRDVDVTPNSFGDKNANFYFDKIDSRWQSILHMKGWTGSYAAWELAGNAHNSSNDSTLKYRQGIDDTWGDWQTVLTNKNIGSYASASGCLPLSGGTLTGKLTLPNNLYYASASTAGIDMNNSDIIGANAIYFDDISNSAGEAINFYRDSDIWDTLYARSGILKFHPNRSTSTDLSGYRVYDASYLQFRRGTVTLSSSEAITKSFSSEMPGTPTVMLTPFTSSSGVIPGKVTSVNSTGFTAIIGGSAVSTAKFAYLAIYYG